jgi:hypothetical protein
VGKSSTIRTVTSSEALDQEGMVILRLRCDCTELKKLWAVSLQIVRNVLLKVVVSYAIVHSTVFIQYAAQMYGARLMIEVYIIILQHSCT